MANRKSPSTGETPPVHGDDSSMISVYRSEPLSKVVEVPVFACHDFDGEPVGLLIGSQTGRRKRSPGCEPRNVVGCRPSHNQSCREGMVCLVEVLVDLA